MLCIVVSSLNANTQQRITKRVRREKRALNVFTTHTLLVMDDHKKVITLFLDSMRSQIISKLKDDLMVHRTLKW